MKLSPLITCGGCLRATRDHFRVTVQIGGATVLDVKLCRACASDVGDGARRQVRELRGSAVQR